MDEKKYLYYWDEDANYNPLVAFLYVAGMIVLLLAILSIGVFFVCDKKPKPNKDGKAIIEMSHENNNNESAEWER